MQKEITIKAYTFDELNEKAKDVARAWFIRGNEWDQRYSATFEDAKLAGVTIEDFKTDSWDSVIAFEISLNGSAFDTMNYILQNHGEACDTYKAAKEYDDKLDTLPDLPDESAANYREVERELCESSDALESEFIESLEACFEQMLETELQHMRSNDYVDETILANEYWFTVAGARFVEAD